MLDPGLSQLPEATALAAAEAAEAASPAAKTITNNSFRRRVIKRVYSPCSFNTWCYAHVP